MHLLEIFDKLDKPTLNPAQLAQKYKVDVAQINHELAKGIKVELEHTLDRNVAEEIALDHLNEKLDYYERLSAAENEDETAPTLIDALAVFLPIALKQLDLDHVPKISLVKEITDTKVPTFGRYVNETKTISVVVNKRQPVDILRTLAHEMVHYKQDTEHELASGSWHTGSPEENQAHELAGIIMREFDKAYPEYLNAEPVLLPEAWSKKYKDSINCSNPKGFSQKAHCAGRKKANENFADGKNPGRKGQAKRSGVDTKASVTDLRKTAKNSTGEKQRMAHWLANMKSGRSK